MYADKIKAIKLAAALEFGKEAEIEFAEGKRVDTNGDCWRSRQVEIENDPFFYRLDVTRGEANSHTIFDLKRDLPREEIERKFKALNVTYEEYIGAFV